MLMYIYAYVIIAYIYISLSFSEGGAGRNLVYAQFRNNQNVQRNWICAFVTLCCKCTNQDFFGRMFLDLNVRQIQDDIHAGFWT